jgi:hypothetical protein
MINNDWGNNDWGSELGFQQEFDLHRCLQQFATQVSYVSCLQTGGKLGSEEAYLQIQSLYKQLQQAQH